MWWIWILAIALYSSFIMYCCLRANREYEDSHPCESCSRWSECNGVDWDEDCGCGRRW